MKNVYFYTLGLKYNSIRLQTELLSKHIFSLWNKACIFTHEIKEALHYSSNPDNVVFITYGSYIPGLFFRKSFKNIVFIFHNITPPKYFWKTEPLVALLSLMGYFQLFILSFRSTKWIAVSEYNKRVLEKLGHKHVDVCPNIIDSDNNMKTINSCKDEIPSLLFVGRIVENKDCIELLKIAYQVAEGYDGKLKLIIVGDGKKGSTYLNKFTNIVNSNNHSNLEIIWKRNVSYNELMALYRKSWLYVTLSKHEGFGLPVCEGLINGIPALYTSCGGQESIMNNHGLCTKKQMTQEIKELLKDHNKRQRLFVQQREVIKAYQTPMVDETIKAVYAKYID